MTKTHIYFLLDRTGSMGSIASDVIGGFNQFLAAQRADGADARMTLVQFDSGAPFEVLADAKRIDRIADLTPATYEPRGTTPLLDATGAIIKYAAARVAKRAAENKPAEQILVVTSLTAKKTRRTTTRVSTCSTSSRPRKPKAGRSSSSVPASTPAAKRAGSATPQVRPRLGSPTDRVRPWRSTAVAGNRGDAWQGAPR